MTICSVISSPCGSKTFSPTGTPLNSPIHTPPETPRNETVDQKPESGIVHGFFASLKAALYGEQRKEAQAHIRRNHHHKKRQQQQKKLGILEKVEEVGVENLLSASPHPSFLSSSSRESSMSRTSSHWDIDRDELEDIRPGSLTTSNNPRNNEGLGQLTAPPFAGRPSLSPGDFGSVPSGASGSDSGLVGGGPIIGGRGPGRVISSPGEKRPYVGALGVPSTPGTGALKNPTGIRPDLGSVPTTKSAENAGFIGSITNMFFNRKGGLL